MWLAWKHGHQKMLFMDGTFGVSKDRILLFIMLVIDGSGKGVLLRSSSLHHRSMPNTSSNYDGRILEDFLRNWEEHLNKNKPDNIGVTSFEALVSVLCNIQKGSTKGCDALRTASPISRYRRKNYGMT
jgi:hypothetical protein